MQRRLDAAADSVLGETVDFTVDKETNGVVLTVGDKQVPASRQVLGVFGLTGTITSRLVAVAKASSSVAISYSARPTSFR